MAERAEDRHLNEPDLVIYSIAINVNGRDLIIRPMILWLSNITYTVQG